jgi:peptidoglycan/xylan/chitin deacetylase (PgdA/CDA1 family)
LSSVITIAIVFTIVLYPLLPTLAHSQQQSAFAYQTTIPGHNNNNLSGGSSNSTDKVVILNFYDDDKDQFTNAKPILDKYGFKGTFFIVCNWAISDNSILTWQNISKLYSRMSWQDINQLYRDGHEIESHSTRHKVLNKLSTDGLDYEVSQSKQCLHDRIGIYPTVFSPPHNKGSDNATVIKAIAKYYNLSIGGFVTDLMFLHCYGWMRQQQLNTGIPWLQPQQLSVFRTNQTDCRTYSNDGSLNYASKYRIKERTHNALDKRYSHNDTQVFEQFVELVDSQTNYNKNGTINAIPIIGYHDIDNKKTITSTNVSLFDAEMKYLHDNGFKVLTMSDLGYDENSNYLYIKSTNQWGHQLSHWHRQQITNSTRY